MCIRDRHRVVLILPHAALALGGQQADHFAVEGLDADAVAERTLVAEQLALDRVADDAYGLAGALLVVAERAAGNCSMTMGSMSDSQLGVRPMFVRSDNRGESAR